MGSYQSSLNSSDYFADQQNTCYEPVRPSDLEKGQKKPKPQSTCDCQKQYWLEWLGSVP